MGAAAVLALVVALVAGFLASGAWSSAPAPDPNFAIKLAPRPCAYDTSDPYEKKFYEIEGWKAPDFERYPGACERLRFYYGPILVKPGQNDVLIGPVTVEKPDRDGYITRFKPNLVRADGTVPPVEQVHLHHGTWLNYPEYGSGPFFAAGEEKTIAPFPKGYGLPVRASDSWVLLYMVHSAVSQPMETYITYDIDFVPKKEGQDLGLKPAYPIWLDVRPSGYPVFNVQRGFGTRGRCTWPKQECARFDPWGKTIEGQGQRGNGTGTDYKLPSAGESLGRIESFTGGTLVGIGGHLHPGGIQNEIDLVRPGGELVTVKRKSRSRKRCTRKRRGSSRRRRCSKKKRSRRASAARAKKRRSKCRRSRKHGRRRRAKCRKRRARYTYKRVHRVRIYTGKANYWSHTDHSKGGGPPTSWDFSMPALGLPYWGVHVKPGDILRSNATYDTKLQSTYEDMGIAVTLLVPDGADGRPNAPSINPFQARKDTSAGCRSGGLRARRRRLCDKGVVTHGHYTENGNYGGPSGTLNARDGARTSRVLIADFLYTPGDLSSSSGGVPTVKLGSTLRFTNADGAGVYHTVTSCKYPCTGQTGSAFPLGDGGTSGGRQVDFDTGELGLGTPAIGPAKNTLDWDLPVTTQEGYKPGETVTYFCRIHPSMRGAFKVVP